MLHNPPVTEFGKEFNQQRPLSVTDEESDLLYALVRMRKPRVAVETGSGWAISTRRIAAAMMHNATKDARFVTCETDRERWTAADAMLTESFPRLRAEAWNLTGLTTIKDVGSKTPIEFLFIDAGDAFNRANEAQLLLDRPELLASAAIVVTHDAINPGDGDYRRVPEALRQRGWRGLVLDSPAGIAIFKAPTVLKMRTEAFAQEDA